MPIYTSPDGGETVYEQLPNGERKLVEMSQKALLVLHKEQCTKLWD